MYKDSVNVDYKKHVSAGCLFAFALLIALNIIHVGIITGQKSYYLSEKFNSWDWKTYKPVSQLVMVFW